MNAVSGQLGLRVKREIRHIAESEWSEWTSEAKVLSEMVSKSGLQDKSIAIEIGVDPAVLSKAKNGQARLNESDLDAFMDACGSEAWLQFWMLKRGYDPRQLHRIESDLERENRLLREQLERVQREREVELRLFRDLRVAA